MKRKEKKNLGSLLWGFQVGRHYYMTTPHYKLRITNTFLIEKREAVWQTGKNRQKIKERKKGGKTSARRPCMVTLTFARLKYGGVVHST